MHRLLAMPAAIVLAGAAATVPAMPIRTIDGSGNNLLDSGLGSAGTTLIRLAPNAYADGRSIPRGGDPSSLPSARAVSNAVSAQDKPVYNRRRASDWLWQWGQFLDHDIDLTEVADGNDPFHIEVPVGDKYFDPNGQGGAVIAMQRSLYELDSDNVRQQVNEITAYIDASNVYGSDDVRAEALRANGGAYLRMTNGANGEILLGRNTGGYANAESGPTPSSDYFFAGDVRANEQIGLTAAHTLFAREHNRLVDELSGRLGTDTDLMALRNATISDMGNGVDDTDDFLFEAARKLVGAQIQKITYTEFLPVLLGVDLTSGYQQYDPTEDASISTEFSTAAFRVGHTMLSPELLRVETNGPNSTETEVALRNAFFNPAEIFDNGVDSLLLGLASKRAQRIDTLIIDDVRNFLFGMPGQGGFDLASLNLQRGRDHGLGSLNAVRIARNLLPYATFDDLTGGDADLAAALASVYDSIDDVDLWIGGLAERADGRSMLGQTFTNILMDQFTRLMVGDRFFYLNDMDALQMLDEDFMTETSLSSLILRNSSVDSIQANAFITVSEPGSLVLGLFALILSGLHTRFPVPLARRA